MNECKRGCCNVKVRSAVVLWGCRGLRYRRTNRCRVGAVTSPVIKTNALATKSELAQSDSTPCGDYPVPLHRRPRRQSGQA